MLFPKLKGTHTQVLTLIAVVVGIISIVVTILFFVHAPFKSFVEQGMSATFLPVDLRSATFVQETSGGMRLLIPTFFGYSEAARLASSTLSFARSGNSVVSVNEPQQGMYEILLKDKVVATSTSLIPSITLSHDGSEILFSKGKSATTTLLSAKSRTPIVQPVQFSIFRLNTDTENPLVSAGPRLVGPGTAPLFLDGTRALYFTLGGVVRTNLANRGESKLLLPHVFSSVRLPVYKSPDAEHLAWYDTRNKTLEVYSIESEKLVRTASITPAKLYDFSVGNKGIYELHLSNKGTEVWRRSFDGTAFYKVFTFPASLGITQLVF